MYLRVCQFGGFFPLPMLYSIIAVLLVVTVLLYNYYSSFISTIWSCRKTIEHEKGNLMPISMECDNISHTFPNEIGVGHHDAHNDVSAAGTGTSTDSIAKVSEFVEALFCDLDYNLIVIFSGLFIVAGSFVETGLPSLIWKVRNAS